MNLQDTNVNICYDLKSYKDVVKVTNQFPLESLIPMQLQCPTVADKAIEQENFLNSNELYQNH